jgi:putative restriction endonuclease
VKSEVPVQPDHEPAAHTADCSTSRPVSAYVYPTDIDWFHFLRARSPLDEVNFWQPGGSTEFRRLSPGELFLFRLKRPINKIAGGGVFAHASLFPLYGAWDAFGEKNGVASFQDLFSAISHYRSRNGGSAATTDTQIGCIVLESPFFLPDNEWIDVPSDYHPNLVQGKRFASDSETGRYLSQWGARQLALMQPVVVGEQLPMSMYGEPTLVRQRRGQGAFRLIVSDAYAKRCAVTGEKTLPVLEAAHIKPLASGGEHRIDNGLLLRSDLHTLFDLGYATITPTGQFRVSPKLKETWMNGRVYYELDHSAIRMPEDPEKRPSPLLLEWHNDVIFRP